VSTNPDEALQMVADCEARESRLSDWEAEFVDSIRRQLERGSVHWRDFTDPSDAGATGNGREGGRV